MSTQRMQIPYTAVLLFSSLCLSLNIDSSVWSLDTETPDVEKRVHAEENSLPQRESAIFAGGCFWSIEKDFEDAPGVVEVISGYSGGRTKQPTYKTYASGGHREAVFVAYYLNPRLPMLAWSST